MLKHARRSVDQNTSPSTNGKTIAQTANAAKQGGSERQIGGNAALNEDVLDAWILQNLDDLELRNKRVEVLVAAAKPQQYPHVEVMMAIGDIYDKSVE